MLSMQVSARGALSELPRKQPSLLGRVESLRHDTSPVRGKDSQLVLALATTTAAPVSDLNSREKGVSKGSLGSLVIRGQHAVQSTVSGRGIDRSSRREVQRSPPPMSKRHRGSDQINWPVGGGSDNLLLKDGSIPSALGSTTGEVLPHYESI